MYDLVAVGNITIDMFFRGDSLTQKDGRFDLAIGGKYYPDTYHTDLGGSAANVSIQAANLGLDTASVALVGESAFKNLIVQGLIKKSVSTEFLQFERDFMSVSTILLAHSGERTVITYSDKHDHLEISAYALDRIKNSGIVFVGNLSEVSMTDRKNFLSHVKTDSNLVALNFSATDCEKGLAVLQPLINLADVVLMNKYECATLLGKDAEKLDLSKNLYSSLKAGLKVIVVTDGAQGSYAYTPTAVLHEAAIKPKEVIDSTGAGDAYTAAFLVEYQQSKDIQKAMKSGAELASKTLTHIGAH